MFCARGGVASTRSAATTAGGVPRRRSRAAPTPARSVLDSPQKCDVYSDGADIIRCLTAEHGDASESVALGVQVRSSSVSAALVKVEDGTFVSAGAVAKIEDESREAMCRAVKKVVSEWNWRGVVGISITKKVSRRLGVESDSFATMDREVQRIMRAWLPRTERQVCMIHTEAAGYSHLAYSSDESSSEEKVLICTIGQALGAVLYNEGHRVRNTGMNSRITSKWEADLKSLQGEFPHAFSSSSAIPCPDAAPEAFAGWLERLDSYLHQLVEFVEPDRIVLIPTGAAASEPALWEEQIMPRLKVRAATTVGAAAANAATMIVKGAAVGAVAEIRTQEALDHIRKAIGQEVLTLQALTPASLRVAFGTFDQDGDGVLTQADVLAGLERLGLPMSSEKLEQLVRELDENKSGDISFEEFSNWWDRMLLNNPVNLLLSKEDWLHVLETTEPEKLIVLEVSFTFCRPCRAFESTYEALALKYADCRMVRINADTNRSSIELCRDDLGVESSPSFYFFRGGEQVHAVTGTRGLEGAITRLLLPGESGLKEDSPVIVDTDPHIPPPPSTVYR